MNPADPEADPRRTQPVGEREWKRVSVTCDHEPVELQALVIALEDDLAARRFDERCVQVAVEIVRRLEEEEPALSSGVRGLEHRREADLLDRGRDLASQPERRVARLRHAGGGQHAPHHHLVGHRVRRLRADPGQSERLCDGGHDRDGAVGRDGQDAVDAVPPADVGDRVDVLEVDDLGRVGVCEPDGVRLAVNGDHAEAELLGAQDRAPLVSTSADEEDGLHMARY